MRTRLLAACLLAGSVVGAFEVASLNVKWTTPIKEPAKNKASQPIAGGGMPCGNGDTALYVFPLVGSSPTPASPPTPAPPTPVPPMNCSRPSERILEVFCEIPETIGCHDKSCGINPPGVNRTTFGPDPKAAVKAAAEICAKDPECVGFEIEGASCAAGHCWVQFVKMTARLTHPFPDTDWNYFYNVSATSDPVPTPSPAPGGGIDLKKADGSVSFFVNKADAMASDTSLFKLGLVSLVMTPNPFENGADFSQELDLQTAVVSVKGGNTEVKIYVDANSNTIHADMTSDKPVQLNVLVQSVHPNSRFAYGGGFGFGTPESDPDVMMQEEDLMMGGPRGFAPDTLVVYHENKDTDRPRAFNDTLTQQGLEKLIPELQSSDHWRGRKFGMAVSGTFATASEVGDGVGAHTTLQTMRRVSEGALESDGMTTEAHVLISTSSNQTSLVKWLQQLQQQHAAEIQHSAVQSSDGGPHSTWQEHADYWQEFWQRSYISVNASTGTGAGTSTSTSTSDDGFVLSQQYALTRFVQAIQSRDQGGNGWVPIKFNGMMFTAEVKSSYSCPSFVHTLIIRTRTQHTRTLIVHTRVHALTLSLTHAPRFQVGPEATKSGPTFRDWGANEWWQNTRLPYWTMLPSVSQSQCLTMHNRSTNHIRPTEYTVLLLTALLLTALPFAAGRCRHDEGDPRILPPDAAIELSKDAAVFQPHRSCIRALAHSHIAHTNASME
jgi:hypothetical protein